MSMLLNVIATRMVNHKKCQHYTNTAAVHIRWANKPRSNVCSSIIAWWHRYAILHEPFTTERWFIYVFRLRCGLVNIARAPAFITDLSCKYCVRTYLRTVCAWCVWRVKYVAHTLITIHNTSLDTIITM